VDYTGPLRKSRNTKCEFTQDGPLAREGGGEQKLGGRKTFEFNEFSIVDEERTL